MPVLPLVGSRSSRPGSSSPDSSAASIIAFATRSLIDPVGFWPSSFAYRRTDSFGVSRFSSTRGVDPTRESRLSATTLRISFPDIHGRAELAEHLVDAPHRAGPRRGHSRIAVALDQVVRPSAEASQPEELGACVPVPVLDH